MFAPRSIRSRLARASSAAAAASGSPAAGAARRARPAAAAALFSSASALRPSIVVPRDAQKPLTRASGASLRAHAMSTGKEDAFEMPLTGSDFVAPCISDPPTCAIVGAPLCLGQARDGVELGPDLLRDSGVASVIADLGWRVSDKGNVRFPSTGRAAKNAMAKNQVSVGAASKAIHDVVFEQAAKGRFVLTIGGDHSIGIGSIAGILAARPETRVLWIDAHADIHTPATSPSSNLHGMVLGFLMHLCDPVSLAGGGFEWMKDVPRLHPSRLCYVGLRDLEQPERVAIHQNGIRAFSMQDIDKHGIGKVMEMAFDHLFKDGEFPLHISYDIDAIDPFLAPSTGTRVRGGLTYREAHYVVESAAETCQVGSMDLAEVNPDLDFKSLKTDAQDTAEMAIGVIGSALGQRVL